MKKLALALAVACSLSSCNAQEKKSEPGDQSHLQDQTEVQTEPRGSWKVSKEVDENGNLIRYDSIYTYSYGNINGKQIPPRKMDSAMASFQKYMKEVMPPSFFQGMMTHPSANDSLRNNFFEKNVFENHWEDFFPEMKQQLRMMDSLHQQFIRNAEPNLFPLEESSDKPKNKI